MFAERDFGHLTDPLQASSTSTAPLHLRFTIYEHGEAVKHIMWVMQGDVQVRLTPQDEQAYTSKEALAGEFSNVVDEGKVTESARAYSH